MKKRLWNAIECILACLVLALALNGISDLVMRKNYITRTKPFYDQQEDFDVLFFGTSHMQTGIFPMELWEDYGIISYNLATAGEQLGTIYWYMENALEYTEPKLVVIDCYYLHNEIKAATGFFRVQELMDDFPLSDIKLRAVKDLLQDPEIERLSETDRTIDLKERKASSLLWGYSVYHDRWDELNQGDFKLNLSKEYGATLQTVVVAADETADIPAAQKMEGDTVGLEYLEKMIRDCQDRNIEVLLVYLPFAANEVYQEEANRVYDVASQYGVDYINFLREDTVNYEVDFVENNNANGHLNASGARKVTDYLGQYIMEHYEIPDQRDNAAYDGWDQAYAEYAQFKVEKLKGQKVLDSYLMLLADKNYNVVMELNAAEILQNEMYRNLLANLGIDTEKITDATDFIAVREAGASADCAGHFLDSEAVTALGTFRTAPGEDGSYVVYRDDEEFYTVTAEQKASADIRIVVCDKDTMQIVDRAEFDLTEQSVRK